MGWKVCAVLCGGNIGRGVDFRHTLDECPEQEQALVVEEVKH